MILRPKRELSVRELTLAAVVAASPGALEEVGE